MRTTALIAYALFLKYYIQFQMHSFSMHTFFLLHIDGNSMVLIVFCMIFYQTNIFFHLFDFFFHSIFFKFKPYLKIFFSNIFLWEIFSFGYFSGWFFLLFGFFLVVGFFLVCFFFLVDCFLQDTCFFLRMQFSNMFSSEHYILSTILSFKHFIIQYKQRNQPSYLYANKIAIYSN